MFTPLRGWFRNGQWYRSDGMGYDKLFDKRRYIQQDITEVNWRWGRCVDVCSCWIEVLEKW